MRTIEQTNCNRTFHSVVRNIVLLKLFDVKKVLKKSNTGLSARPAFPQVWFAAYEISSTHWNYGWCAHPFACADASSLNLDIGLNLDGVWTVFIWQNSNSRTNKTWSRSILCKITVKVSSIIWYGMIYYSAPASPVLIYYMKY